MQPEEIHHRDFLVGLRGYDKDEVRSFLADVAAEHAGVLRELEQLREMVAAQPAAATIRDDFEDLGASVASILRAAKESAAELTGEAEQHAASIRSEAAAIREGAIAEGERIIAAARDRAAAMEAEIEERVEARVREATDHAAALKQRLLEAGDELSNALEALGAEGETVDLREGLGRTTAPS